MIGKPKAEVESGELKGRDPISLGGRPGKAAAAELKICGLAAVRARFQRDPASIHRLYFDYATGRKIGLICKALAASRKIYRCVEPGELEKIAGTIHHGGIVATVADSSAAFVAPGDARIWARRSESLLVLDRIGNAHNLGAIARTAAFLGLPRIVIPDDPAAAQPNEAAYRVAEGGLEFVEVRRCARLAAFLGELAAAGYEVVGAATEGGEGVKGWPPTSGRRLASIAEPPAPGGWRPPQNNDSTSIATVPIAIVLGNEEHGLAPGVAKACTKLVTIPGGGRVESLNVSVAAAILMWELLKGRIGPKQDRSAPSPGR